MSNILKKISARAKLIYKAHPSKKWTDCIKQASRELKGKKSPIKRRKAPTKTRKAAPARKRAKVGRAPKKYRQTGRTTKSRDKLLSAQLPGKRVVKTASGSHVYYERRANRSDKPGKLTGVVSGIGQDYAIQRVIMKRALRKAGVTVDVNVADNYLQLAYRKIVGRKIPTISAIRAKLKKNVPVQTIIESYLR